MHIPELEYLNIVNGHLSIKQKFSAIIISCECKYLHSNFHRLPYLLGIKFNYLICQESQDTSTHKKKRKRGNYYFGSIPRDTKIICNRLSNIFIIHFHMNKDQLQRIIVQLKYVFVQKPRFFEGCVKTKFYSFLNDALDTCLRDDAYYCEQIV
jgi:hypothetical protein